MDETTTASRQLKLDLVPVGSPKYERLRSYLLSQVTSGQWKAGDALPSEQCLARSFKVARSTVRQALSGLDQEGLIERIRGKGTFVHQDVRRRLRRGLDVFALVTPETRSGWYPSLLHGFETASGQVHHQAIIRNTDNDINKQAAIILQLLDIRVAGVALVPATRPPTPAYQVRQLQERGIPVVFCHRRVEGVQAPLVGISFYDVGQLAGEAFVRHGHRRVALFETHRDDASDATELGLREAMRAVGGDLPAEFVYCGTSISPDFATQEAKFFEALKRMCSSPHPPTAISTTFDPLAELLFLLLSRLGLRAGADIALVGFGGTWRENVVPRELTSVAVDEAELGRRAAELLYQMRTGERDLDDNEETMMPLCLTDGQTLSTL